MTDQRALAVEMRRGHGAGPAVNRIGPDFGKRFCASCHGAWPCLQERAAAALEDGAAATEALRRIRGVAETRGDHWYAHIAGVGLGIEESGAPLHAVAAAAEGSKER